MSNVLEANIDELTDEVFTSMREQVFDVWRVQGTWPFPRYDERGHVIRLRRVTPPFDLNKCEEALI
jgi:hypothetical protein